ncbi:MAG: hypothetical protein AB7K52_11055 [Phycisphaerales bacterium]
MMSTKNMAKLAAGLLAAGLSGANAAGQVSTFDDLPEGFLGAGFSYNGVTYRDVNGVPGSFPSGETFDADYPGSNFIIENSTLLFNDFPAWGSSPNTLTFGNAFVPGNNLSVGGFSRASMDFASPVSGISMNIIFYEDGPWGGIVLHLDGRRNGAVVATSTYTLSDLGGRDRLTNGTLSISGEFDSADIYATWGAGYSAPRLMIDDLTLTPAVPTCPADFNADGNLDPDDLGDYINCYFSLPPCDQADFNADTNVDPDDLGDFINAYFTGC